MPNSLSFNDLIRMYDYYKRMSILYINSDWDKDEEYEHQYCQFDYLASCMLKEIEARI